MKAFYFIIRLLSFIILSTINFEYCINQPSSWALLFVGISAEILIFYFLLLTYIKQILK